MKTGESFRRNRSGFYVSGGAGQNMEQGEPIEGTRLELYVRSLSPGGARPQQAAVIDRLERLETEHATVDVTVTVWGKEIGTTTPAARTDAGQFILERVSEFREWARERGRSIDSFFETREVHSSITGEEYTALVLPVMTLAEYHDGSLRFVAPSANGETVYTVSDRVDALEHRIASDQGVYRPPETSSTAGEYTVGRNY